MIAFARRAGEGSPDASLTVVGRLREVLGGLNVAVLRPAGAG